MLCVASHTALSHKQIYVMPQYNVCIQLLNQTIAPSTPVLLTMPIQNFKKEI